ncbi:Sel1 domain protein repeat-containing protein [Elusimicrobium minutum Pei191]|uniref:Sel1 domain protein repeat-containing protein n=1 Tax=Elusimicrobium minutum (strain Pei191) TaxID=445932 RepID=B2KBG9_ELUMP|nr:tetratricopeptide repeat protein [Elusimicrobium minutum]ACC97991.1 Sel1 domain protein repeat-containing protein [Elusimicrobium minutum Pei191]
MKKIIYIFLLLPFIFACSETTDLGREDNVPPALESVFKSAKKGDAEAQLKIAKAYFDGLEGMPLNYEKGFYWAQKSAKGGNNDALREVGFSYLNARGVKRDFRTALKHLTNAADSGNVQAMLDIAALYYDLKKPREEYEWYEKAAASGAEAGMQILVDRYCYAARKDGEKCLIWLTKLADGGSIEAMKQLAQIYEKGEITAKTLEKTEYWYERAAQAGDVEAMSLVGQAYALGSMHTKDAKLAFKWNLEAAKQGNEKAIFALCSSYIYGQFTSKDMKKAVEWCTKAAEKNSVKAMYYLGIIYERPYAPVKKDLPKAVSWFTKAAQAGDGSSIGELSLYYLKAKNYDKAFEWASKGALLDNEQSAYVLGHLYMHGLGVKKDLAQALKWNTKVVSLNKENFLYMYNLAEVYTAQRKYSNAFTWYLRAAKAGHEPSMKELVVMYVAGRGTEKNLDAARYWQKKIEGK